MRQSSSMKRLRKGDLFRVDGILLQCNGFPQRVSDEPVSMGGKVQIPVIVDGATRCSRRTFVGNRRVRLLNS